MQARQHDAYDTQQGKTLKNMKNKSRVVEDARSW